MKETGFERIERFFKVVVTRRVSERLWSRRIRMLLWFLRQMSRLYSVVVRTRLFLYEVGILRFHALGCQVISVGNLTVGGTGKTPVVEVFARALQKEGRKVAILSRGYRKVELSVTRRIVDKITLRARQRPPRVVSDGKRLLLDSSMSGDEPYMLASNLRDVVVLVDKDRVKSGRYAVSKMGCDTLVLDDGFQYLALRHMVEIVLVDSTNPFGNECVLPRGMLREPVRNIRRANFIFITKCGPEGAPELKARLREYNRKAEIVECRHTARYLQNVFTAEQKEVDFLRGLKVLALSGIAMPAGFEDELAARGAALVNRQRFADHHRYEQQEIIDIINLAKELGADAIITTEKDAVRFPELHRWDVPVYFLRVDIEILSGAEDFRQLISRICFR